MKSYWFQNRPDCISETFELLYGSVVPVVIRTLRIWVPIVRPKTVPVAIFWNSEPCITVDHFTRGRFFWQKCVIWVRENEITITCRVRTSRVLPRPSRGSCFRSFRLPFLTHPNHRQMLTCLHTRYIRITYPCTWTSIFLREGTLAEIKCAAGKRLMDCWIW